MRRFIYDGIAFYLGVMLAFMWIDAHSATFIDVCGTSSYTCVMQGAGTAVGAQNLGDPVGAVTISDDVTSKSVQIPIGTNSKGQCPAGWTNCGPGQVPAPPATVSSTGTTYRGSFPSGSPGPGQPTPISNICAGSTSVADLANCSCPAWEAQSAASNHGCTVVSTTATTYTVNLCQGTAAACASPPSGYQNILANATATVNCPAGYTWNGTTCALSNAALAMKPVDGKCGIVRTGNSYAYDPQDPDCAGVGSAGVQFNLSTASGVVSVGNSTGTLRVTANSSDGSATVKSDTPVSGNTVTKQIAVGPLVGGEFGPTLGTSTTTTQGVGTGTLSPSTDPPKDPCGLPTTAPCKIDETGTPTDGALTVQKAEFDAAVAAAIAEINKTSGANQKTNLGLTFGITWPSVACSDPTFVIPGSGGKSLTVPLCAHKSDVNAVMSWVMFVLTGFYLFGLIREIR